MPEQFQGLPLIAYASWMGTPQLTLSLNQQVAAREGVRLLFEPSQAKFGCIWRRPPMPDDDGWWPYCLDNGRWPARHDLSQWDEWEFWHMVARLHSHADFIVIPDRPPPIDDDDENSVPAGHGKRSFDESCLWLDRLRGCPTERLLFAVQDQMDPAEVESMLESRPEVGLFIGGTSPWKLRTAPIWGEICRRHGRYLHMGRVNSVRRCKIAYDAGCDSVDGGSFGTLFARHVRRLMDGIRDLEPRTAAVSDFPLFQYEG